MSNRRSSLVLALSVMLLPAVARGQQASGSVTATGAVPINVRYATAYIVRDQANARTTETEILLSDVPVDGKPMQEALNPHMVAINLDALKDRNYVLLWVRPDGSVSMNATHSKTMTQYLNDTNGGLKATFTTNTPTRVEGRLVGDRPLKTMDGTTYTVDVKFAADIAKPAAGQALPVGGGEPGKAFTTFVTAALRKNWAGIKAGSSASALKMFERSYNTPAENASDAADLVKAWISTTKMKITGGQLRGDVAILDVEGEQFAGTNGLTLVRMVKVGAVWQFDEATRVGFVK